MGPYLSVYCRYRYPLEENERENAAEDGRCLAMAEEAIERSGAAGWPVTGVIVEPIQAEGGDHHGSNAWFQVIPAPGLPGNLPWCFPFPTLLNPYTCQGLQEICKRKDIVYLIGDYQ